MGLFYSKEEDDMRKAAEESRKNAIRSTFVGAANGLAGNDLREYEKQFNDIANQKADAFADYRKRNRYFGDNIIGTLLNPVAQTVDFLGDAVTGQLGERYNREDAALKNVGTSGWKGSRKTNDLVSDIGALGETAFDVAGMGALGNAVKGGTKLMSNVGKTALRTGLLGAGENAFSTVREQGRDTNLGDVALSGAIGGAIGGALGGGSQLFGNAKAISSLSPSKELMRVSGNAIQTPQYQEALKTLGLTGQDVTSDAINQARKQAMKNTAKTVGYETAEGQAQRMAINNAYQTLLDNANGKATQTVANARPVKLPFAQRMANLKAYMANNPSTSKFGQTTRNLLNSKAGKIGAGVGGGLLLSKLLFGGGGNANQEMSDAELEQLLNNYYNNGGTYGY